MKRPPSKDPLHIKGKRELEIREFSNPNRDHAGGEPPPLHWPEEQTEHIPASQISRTSTQANASQAKKALPGRDSQLPKEQSHGGVCTVLQRCILRDLTRETGKSPDLDQKVP